jgi:hypothetical protein
MTSIASTSLSESNSPAKSSRMIKSSLGGGEGYGINDFSWADSKRRHFFSER